MNDYCDKCGNEVEKTYEVINQHNDYFYYCYDCYSDTRKIIRFPFIKPIDASEKKFYYGFEIEFELNKLPSKKHLNIYFKETFEDKKDIVYTIDQDGSLSRLFGVEISTQPISEDELYKIKDIYDYVNKYGFIENTRAALHINVDRRCISKLTLMKMFYFLSNNLLFTDFYSERNSNYYYCDLTNKREFINKMLNKITEMKKYSGINLNYKERYEFRIFNATKNYKNAINKAKFIKRLANFLKTKSIQDILSADDKLYYEFVELETSEILKEVKNNNIPQS